MRASIVIPTYRRPDLLRRCLHALLRQQVAHDQYEIIVCDDAASLACERVIQDVAATTDVRVHYLPVTRRHGPAAARNVGWRAARGEIVAFTDDDTIPEPRWLREALEAFGDDVVGAWGRIVVPLGPRPTDFELDTAGLENAQCATANCFYRRSALARVGGFDERFETAWREDADLFFTLLHHGHVVHVPSAVVTHPARHAHWGVSIGQQRKAMYNALLYKKHPQLYRERIQPRAPWLYYFTVVNFLLAAVGVALQQRELAAFAGATWLVLVLRLAMQRLRRTARYPAHVAEMIWTSMWIPFLSIYWRIRGALKYRVLFW